MQAPDIIRDPLYGPVSLEGTARRLVDSAPFQRLRRIRQLSEAHAVYPSAVHTRFEHSLGVYHLARGIVRRLAERGELNGDPGESELVTLAALLHDVGHHPGAHLLEEFGYPGVSHEMAGATQFTSGEIGEILADSGLPDAGRRVAELVRHEGSHPLGGIVSGPCDADKLDYLVRDAYHCGLPSGFDQAHLASALTLLEDPSSGVIEVGLDADALVSFEQMLVSKNSLYRTVYFHPTVRCAMVMLRAILVRALECQLLTMDELLSWTDEEVFTLLRVRIGGQRAVGTDQRYVGSMIERLLARRLFVRVASLPLASAPDLTPASVARMESDIARVNGLDRGDVLIDIPRKPEMLSTDILVRRASDVVRASALGPDDGFALNQAQPALYAASGRVSVFSSVRFDLSQQVLERMLRAS
jgi:uncharacterized protein